MILTLISFSGAGKSYWAKRLVNERGFICYCCDDMIEQKLATHLKAGAYSGIHGVANWMGQPYESKFKRHQALYLECEIEVMKEVLGIIESRNFKKSDNIFIDTSGSVIYTGKDICNRLKACSTVVYLDVPEAEIDRMFVQYLANPKPVIWGEVFNKLEGESDQDALARCYPELLTFRAALYQQYADLVIPFNRHKASDCSSNDFLNLLNKT